MTEYGLCRQAAPRPDDEQHPVKRPWLGYAMVLSAATLFAVNGVVAKVVLSSGLSALRLTEVRITGAAVVLVVALALFRRDLLHVTWRDVPFLAVFGILGLVFVQWLYLLAIHRLEIGIALLIQYLAPLLVALWVRFVVHRPVRRRIWLALALALFGLSLVVQIWKGSGTGLNGLGVLAALGGAFAFAAYILMAERGVKQRDAVSLTTFGFVFGALFFAIVQPWWTFPTGRVSQDVSLLGHLAGSHLPVWALLLWIIVLGAVVPFALFVGALHHIPATRASIVSMFEPVVASAVAWAWLNESLDPMQVFGGVIVLCGIALAQTAREDAPD